MSRPSSVLVSCANAWCGWRLGYEVARCTVERLIRQLGLVGVTRGAYDNALAESQIGLYKSELINCHDPYRDREHVEIDTLDWVHWFNTDRPHESLDDLTPLEVEQLHYTHRTGLTETG